MTRRDTSLNSSSASRVRPDVSVALPVGWQHVGHRESMNALDYAQQPLFDFLHTTARALRRGWTHLAPRRDAPRGVIECRAEAVHHRVRQVESRPPD